MILLTSKQMFCFVFEIAIDYTPSVKLTAFVGADLKPLGIKVWHKEADLTIANMVLKELQGCITKAEFLRIQQKLNADGITLTDNRRRLTNALLQDTYIGNFSKANTYATSDRPFGLCLFLCLYFMFLNFFVFKTKKKNKFGHTHKYTHTWIL